MITKATYGGMFGEDWKRRGLTGRYIVTFRKAAKAEGLSLMEKVAGVSNLAHAADFTAGALDLEQSQQAGGAVFDKLEVAVVRLAPDAFNALSATAAHDSAILAVEPERMMYALGDFPQRSKNTGNISVSLEYLRGYRDSISSLYEQLAGKAEAEAEALAVPSTITPSVTFEDTEESTWGLKATRVLESNYSGAGVRVAVLDTGLDLNHPDFVGRDIVKQSFIAGEDVQDGHGHGTHCIGTASGLQHPTTGPRYGIAYKAQIYAGKVLSNEGSGADEGILAGIEWAITNNCQVISMSLGADVKEPSQVYENVGCRALQAGSLIIAAAGNNAWRPWWPGYVGMPANSKSIMAVAAVDSEMAIAGFSARSSGINGGEVDIAGPGVDVYSSWPMPTQYRSISGTSMATPHVAGIAALMVEASGANASELWRMLTANALRLSLSSEDVGAGLVQALGVVSDPCS